MLHVCALSCFSRVQLFVTLWTAARQAPLPMGFSGKNTGVGCHALLQGIFLTQELNWHPLHLLALVGGFFTTSATWEAPFKDKQLLSALPWPHPRWALLDWNEATAEGAGAH